MSQSTAREKRKASTNGTAVEKLPDLEDFLGLNDLAELDVDRIRGQARTLRNLSRIQLEEGLKDSDAIPGPNPEGRTFTQQKALIKQAYAKTMQAADEGGYKGLVLQRLGELKS